MSIISGFNTKSTIQGKSHYDVDYSSSLFLNNTESSYSGPLIRLNTLQNNNITEIQFGKLMIGTQLINGDNHQFYIKNLLTKEDLFKVDNFELYLNPPYPCFLSPSKKSFPNFLAISISSFNFLFSLSSRFLFDFG